MTGENFLCRREPLRQIVARSMGACLLFVLAATVVAAICFGLADAATAQNLTPSNVYMSGYNAARINDTDVANTRANAFTIMTNGIVNRGA